MELKQEAYLKKVLEKVGMGSCNLTKFPMDPKTVITNDEGGAVVNSTEYKSIICGLRYLVHTRPDISYAVGIISRYMEKPTVMHLNAAKKILRFGVSDKAFTDLLESVGSFLPKEHVLPGSMYEAKKTLTDLGLEYVKIHACPNDCVLYRGPAAESLSECPKCHLSRWKIGKDGKVRVNVPAKVMWYFPIIPRFKRVFKSAATAKLMSWHAENRSKDGKMRHPSDSPAWRNVDCRWPEFGSEARNIRLGLAADGINPHNNGLNNRYSCWPVMLVMYNLPSWLCMKRKFMMLSTLISGPYEPGNNIDIYLQPIIDDLKKLWEEGEPNVYDAHNKSVFTLKAVLMWTVNDFSGYRNLSGCINKGYKACPVCGDNTASRYLSHSRKMCYLGHRRYLDEHHHYRRQQIAFDGQQELGYTPEPLSEEEVLMQQQQLEFSFGRGEGKKDVMHIEKNVCDNIIGTLLNMKYKTKDSVASRLDMIDMGVRTDLAPEIGCIAEGYLTEELTEFCTGFFSESSRTAGLQKDDDKFSGPLGHVTMKSVAEKERDEAHLTVLLNNPEVEPYVRLHKEHLERIYQGKKKSIQWLLGEHNRQFPDWFQQKVSIEMRENSEAVSETIRWLAEKSSFSVLTYEGYIIDGVRYHTKE
ncbi:uncharacterized protein LOC141714296 [Apium graveolens]|uniref:uncharacterized protein LOC141714296 n=1 Tax=Apium graveolens TaxID=4045 RepID=UPI003D7BD6A1